MIKYDKKCGPISIPTSGSSGHGVNAVSLPIEEECMRDVKIAVYDGGER